MTETKRKSTLVDVIDELSSEPYFVQVYFATDGFNLMRRYYNDWIEATAWDLLDAFALLQDRYLERAQTDFDAESEMKRQWLGVDYATPWFTRV